MGKALGRRACHSLNVGMDKGTDQLQAEGRLKRPVGGLRGIGGELSEGLGEDSRSEDIARKTRMD